jgi:hypothetical protein
MNARSFVPLLVCLLLFPVPGKAAVLYVDAGSTNSIVPFSTWATAATSIQDAVDVTVDGDEVLVTNGIYASGGRIDNFGAPYGDALTNRVVITNSIFVHSVNGPDVTIIQGNQVEGTTNGLAAVRCLFIEQDLPAVVSGFTLAKGATLLHSQLGFGSSDNQGGGVFCWTSSGAWSPAIISNCCITSCSSGEKGGGVCGGIYLGCVISNNSAVFGGGAYSADLSNCIIANNSANVVISSMPYGNMGGGALDCRLANCQLLNNYSANLGGGTCSFSISSPATSCVYSNNSAPSGAGTYSGNLTNCVFWKNTGVSANYGSLYNCILKYSSGTGASGSTLCNCTLVGNALGMANASAYNCIIYDNTNEYTGSSLVNCCSRLATAGSFAAQRNFTNAPAFVDETGGDFHLQSNSPCINAGANVNVQTTLDLDGHPRIIGTNVDVGAFEYPAPLSNLPYYWLQQYGLPTDGSADHVDSDGDNADNWLEWQWSTDPTNSQSLLAMFPLTNGLPGLYVAWRSVGTVNTYFVQRSTNLLSTPAFVTIRSNLPGSTTGMTRIRDGSATNGASYFYRVGIQ